MGKVTAEIKVADEVWIATALLHREQPTASDFSVREIKARLIQEGLTARSVDPYLSVNCVANKPPDRGRYRVLFETAPSRRRLFRPGDVYDPRREGGQVLPERHQIPPRYHALLDWYEREWAPAPIDDPLAALKQKYPAVWRDVEPDDYVRQLREGWE